MIRKFSTKNDFGLAPHEAYFTFRPRPDNSSKKDQQTSFYYSDARGVIFLIGGNGAGTTSCSVAKACKFLLSEQPPPRADTPFWVISDTFETVCESVWKEKMLEHGHLPVAEIDYEKIQWYKELRNWPLAVPLKSWPSTPGRNWVIEFKSYKQGRHLMQARSIGGFLFCEQFPWALLTEVLRGCREYDFAGSKICEYTPIEPGLTEELDDMLEKDTLPAGWEIFRANTACALEHGHVTQAWFDQFFAMVPESMRETRMTGESPSYEGAIYPTFDRKLHCHDIQGHKFPEGAKHYRSIDFGSGPNNAFVCLWAYKHLGRWYIYDEYYSTDLDRNVIDHLCQIQDRWPWPEDHVDYKTTWADPSGTAYFRIAARLWEHAERNHDGTPKYRGMSLSAANNSVLQGIEHVQYLLKPQRGSMSPFLEDKTIKLPGGYVGWPQVFIDRDNCPNLKREMRTYRWQQRNDEARQPKDARPEPLKVDDHAVDALRYLLMSEAGYTIRQMASAHSPKTKPRDFGVHLANGGRRRIPFQGRNR